MFIFFILFSKVFTIYLVELFYFFCYFSIFWFSIFRLILFHFLFVFNSFSFCQIKELFMQEAWKRMKKLSKLISGCFSSTSEWPIFEEKNRLNVSFSRIFLKNIFVKMFLNFKKHFRFLFSDFRFQIFEKKWNIKMKKIIFFMKWYYYDIIFK